MKRLVILLVILLALPAVAQDTPPFAGEALYGWLNPAGDTLALRLLPNLNAPVLAQARRGQLVGWEWGDPVAVRSGLDWKRVRLYRADAPPLDGWLALERPTWAIQLLCTCMNE